MRTAFNRKYLAALLLALACVLALAGAGWQTLLQLRGDVALTKHTREAQNQIGVVYVSMLDLENSHRALLLTRATAGFEPYQKALRQLDTEMDALAVMTAAHAAQGADLVRLQALVLRRRDELSLAIHPPPASGDAAMLQAIRSGEGSVLMTQIRDVLERMDHEEARALAQHEAAADGTVRRNIGLGVAASAVAALMLSSIYLLMRRELAARQRAERAEAEQRALLEHNIELRSRELAQATDALTVSEARLRGIFDSATDAILTVDQAQVIVLANPAAARMLRCPAAQLVGSALERFVPPPARVRHREHIEAFGAMPTRARAMSPQREVSGQRTDGELFPIEAAISHLHVGGQELYTVILRDITERKQAEAALRESEARLRRVLMLLPDGVFVSSGGRISFVNETAQRLFGADESALLGRSPMQWVHPDSKASVQARIAALQAGEAVGPPREAKLQRADGTVVEVETTAARVDLHGEQSMIVILRDIGERKRADAKLQQVQRELSRSHGDLQRLVSVQGQVQEEERKRIARELHDDLQQKLAAILMNLSAAGGQIPRDSGNAAAALAAADELAAAAIESTRRIVNDLRPQVLDDLGLVAALQVLASHFSRASGVACQVRAEPAAAQRAALSADVATCLYRVAQESLNNVAKHAQANEVQIELARAGQQGIVLRVRDDGSGMATASPRKPDSFGLLGMQERLRRVGGSLKLHSQSGGGTTVEARVPMKCKAIA